MFLSSVFNLFHLSFRGTPLLGSQPFLPPRTASSPSDASQQGGRGACRRFCGIKSFLTRLQLVMAHKRQKRAEPIDTSYASEGDVFRVNANYMKKGYTKQVPAPPIHGQFAAMQHQVHQGQIEVDTMILLDVSSSMGWDHTGFDQPRHVGVSGYLNIHVCCSDNCYRCRT